MYGLLASSKVPVRTRKCSSCGVPFAPSFYADGPSCFYCVMDTDWDPRPILVRARSLAVGEASVYLDGSEVVIEWRPRRGVIVTVEVNSYNEVRGPLMNGSLMKKALIGNDLDRSCLEHARAVEEVLDREVPDLLIQLEPVTGRLENAVSVG